MRKAETSLTENDHSGLSLWSPLVPGEYKADMASFEKERTYRWDDGGKLLVYPIYGVGPSSEGHAPFAVLPRAYGRTDVYDLLHRRATVRGVLVATVESCTGGGIAEEITKRSGSSAYMYGSWVTYANHAKYAMVGVSPYDIRDAGAVSLPVLTAMLKGAFERSPVTHAVAVTGIAGPGGGTEEKPVGTVWIGIASRKRPALDADDYASDSRTARFVGRCFRFEGTRAEIREQTIVTAGLMLLELIHLQEENVDIPPFV